MKQKLLFFFLTAFLSLIGGGELWAQTTTTVGYTEAIDETTKTLQPRSLSNGGLDHLTISDAIFGSKITDHKGTSKTVYVGSDGYTSTDSWRKSAESTNYDDDQYVGYTLTVDKGYRLNISKVAAKILVADNTYTWKVEIENSSGTKIYTSANNNNLNADKTSQDALADNVSLSHLEGTVTVKLYMYQRGSTKYFCINYLELDVTVEEDPRATLTVFDKEGTWPSPFGFVEGVASSKQKTLMFKFNEASSSGALTKVDQTKLSVTSDNTGVFTIGSYTVGVNGSGNRERINIPIQVVSEGTANVVVSFAGDDNFKPHDAVSIPITTKNIKLETYSSYPFTWDFANNDWESSKIQMAANSTDWASYSGEGRSKQSSVSATSGIDMIEGLAFSGLTADDGTSSNGTLCLEWTNKAVWLNGTVTLPALLRGHTVKIASNAVPTAVAAGLTRMTSEETAGVYVYRATAAVASPTFTFSGNHIYSIEVSRTTIQLIYDNEDTKGCLKGATPTLNLGTSDNWGNYAFNVIPGIDNIEYTATSLPSGILDVRYKDGKYMANNGGYNYLTLTGTTTGTAHITVTISPVGEHAFDIVGPYEFDVRVVQNAVPTKWEFENTGKWTTETAAALGADGTNWQSGTAANEYKNKNKINGTELYVGETKMKETAGLYITAEKGAIQVNPTNGYVRIGNASRANIVIPNAVAEQTITFKVKTATAGKECGIQAASSNLALISGTVAGDVSYYTFRVTNNGDIKFTQTSSDTDLFIYYIDLKAATPANTGLKFVHGSDDISNTKVNIVSGVTGALDSYFTLAQGGSVDWANVTVAVSPSSLITYDNDGTFTMGSGTGTATITARTTDSSSSVETGIAVLYVSVKAQPTVMLSANGPFSVDYGHDFNNNTSTVTGMSSEESLTVKYKSSNERVATVDANGHVTCVGVGTATITAYTEETTDYLYAEASYDVTYNSGNVVFQFEPSEVKLAYGKNITPYLHYDQSGSLDPATLNFTMSKSGIVTCQVVADDKQSDKNVIKITSVDDASKIGETVIVTASATMKNSSVVYNTTIAVTITAAGTRNFSWADGESPTYTMYVGDYMKMPAITGNSNGNDSYSKTDAQKYIYHIEAVKNKVTWNTDGYYLYEGVPDYGIIDNGTEDNNGTHAAIFYAKGQPSNGIPHTLFLYARAAGTVTIRAYDPQNHGLYCDATLKILERTTIDNAASTYINGMKFPYTWDFTGNFDMTDIVANSHYWERFDDNHYAAGIGFFNVDWADSDADNDYNERSFKPFVAGAATGTTAGNYMPLFYGLEMSLQNSDYGPKVDRVRITDYNSNHPDAARLVINGGTTQLRLPKAPNQPSNYRIYMKVKTQSGTKISVTGVSKTYGVKSGEYTEGCQLTANTDAIIYFDVTNTSSADAGSVINLDNVSIYWIATSTEAKILNYYKGTNPNLTYAAAAYSYNEDLDLTKSNEVNGGAAYYASSFTTDNKDAGAFADDGNQYAVVMTPLTIMGNYVTANTGMLLKYDNVSEYTTDTQIPFYMIANPRNVKTYNADETIDGTTHKNYLVGTGSGISSLSGHEKIESTEYTNFLMAAAYKYYTDVTDPTTAQGDYRFDRDWSFYPIMGSGAVPTQRSYLHIPGNLYVNTSGQIVDMPTSARAAFDVDSAADETAEAPATKGALNIVFEDEMPATPDDPATEEPEDGDSDKDKDRPRKPGDDGWPKPPFPPIIITDIDSVNTETTDNAVWHSIEGVRISQPTKPGLYIRNGKKVVIK